MGTTTGSITVRVEPELKARAARVLAKVGISTTDAITMFLTQVVVNDGLPFDVGVPNTKTQKTIAELESLVRRAKLGKFDAAAEMFADVIPRKRKRGTPGV